MFSGERSFGTNHPCDSLFKRSFENLHFEHNMNKLNQSFVWEFDEKQTYLKKKWFLESKITPLKFWGIVHKVSWMYLNP